MMDIVERSELFSLKVHVLSYYLGYLFISRHLFEALKVK